MRHPLLLLLLIPLWSVAQPPAPSFPPNIQPGPPLPAPDKAMLRILNAAEGKWTFEGSTLDTEHLQGVVTVIGQSAPGMLPIWQMKWTWPEENPTHLMQDVIMISPNPERVDLRLIRSTRPIHMKKEMQSPGTSTQNYSGVWNPETTTILWTEILVNENPNKASHPAQFEMQLSPSGIVTLLNPGRMPAEHLRSAKAMEKVNP